ncbi:DUF4230 domain-containing protein [Psychrobacillus lasiicapitis]|uniref:DUF4230 domain-containing protein n=1 Tax=Psychrobacillus lasiicapitis TaxID=1636719 RepID=A0A544TC34_9BACI|nr:DUF4230 domain-containing protein [Psychrobacillus lasiicapitis]TQR15024.1 DUF4230 domain-containing protein [Psychrobacillus lasiicapitis]GGA21833.1 hypothetical protein GCM10011384_09230 [Psychrobacillus lasiicapitis]
MRKDDKIREMEKLLAELKAQKNETTATIAENPSRQGFGFGKIPRALYRFRTKSIILIVIIVLLLLAALPFAAYWAIQGSTFTENKGSIVERVQALNELSTAEAYTKVIIERQDNQLFGKEIGIDLPGTKRQILVVVPGAVRAGVDFSQVTESDIKVDDESKTATLTLPMPKFLGGPEIFFDQVEVFSYEGLFREKADITEAYELAETAKEMMIEETTGQGILQLAEENAEKSVKEMFQLVEYDVQVQFKE